MNRSPAGNFRQAIAGLLRRAGSAAVILSVVLNPAGVRGAEPGRSLGPVAMDSCTQSISVTFRSEAAARAARAAIAPLYHDLRAAFSTRMDDSNLNGLAVAEIMAAHGQRGTFYLNDPRRWWQDSKATGITEPPDPASTVPRRLLANGNSLGGHTLHHEFLPAVSANYAFQEIMGVRVTLESTAQSPVMAFVYPFVNYESKLREGEDRADCEEMLRRAGYYQLGEDRYNRDWDSAMQDAARFVSLDGMPREPEFDETIVEAACQGGERPLFLVTMHAWVDSWGGPDFPKLTALYRRWGGRKDWWYCNQNEYGAYRYAARHSRLTAAVEGRTLKLILTRPDPLDLNDWTPLTLKLTKMDPRDVVSVTCRDTEVQPVDLQGAYGLDVPVARRDGRIDLYAVKSNESNGDRLDEASAGTGDLQTLLYRKGAAATLVLRNAGTDALADVRVTFRLPLRWEQGVVRKTVAVLGAGETATISIPLVERAHPEHYEDGTEYDVAQVDFRRADRRIRVFATCEVAGGEPASYFARGGFWVLGPIAARDAEPKGSFLKDGTPRPTYATASGAVRGWGTLAEDRAAILDPDIIPTAGTSNMAEFNRKQVDAAGSKNFSDTGFLLYGRIVSPGEQRVRAVFADDCVQQLSLNGQVVTGHELTLRKGENDLRLVYAPAATVSGLDRTFDLSTYGCYFRLVDETGQRVKALQFARPANP